MKLGAAWSVAIVVGLSVGCHRGPSPDRDQATGPERPADRQLVNPDDQDKSGTTTLTGASWMANDDAVDRLVASRCAREVTCSNVGPDKHFVSGERCVHEVGTEIRSELNSSSCPAGIDARELDVCLDAIRNESCTNPIDVISRSAVCRTGNLCMKTEMPHR